MPAQVGDEDRQDVGEFGLVLQQVGSVCLGSFEGLVFFPLGDFAVVTAEEDCGYVHVAECVGFGVGGGLK